MDRRSWAARTDEQSRTGTTRERGNSSIAVSHGSSPMKAGEKGLGGGDDLVFIDVLPVLATRDGEPREVVRPGRKRLPEL